MTQPLSSDLRPGERATDAPLRADAALHFIGVIETPFATRADCPKQGTVDGPVCRITLAPAWHAALDGLERLDRVEVYYWLHHARRDLVHQSPRRDGRTTGTFALRSPVRPNPIGMSVVRLVSVARGAVEVRGLDCVTGTPLIDLKPLQCPFAAT